MVASAPNRKRIALALQGGGSHGAFTWGVLDRLLTEPDLEFIGVTGTSAGAMNAIILADGLLRGGPEHARTRLREFWETIGKMPGFGSFMPPIPGDLAAKMKLESTPVYAFWDGLSRLYSPYDLNPLDWHPLHQLLTEMVDFQTVRDRSDFPVAICATNARTARRRVFTNADLTVDAVLASACLPKMFRAIQIDGDPYWDGGFTGNPAVIGLLPHLPDCDLLIVRVDPVIRSDSPRTVSEIHDRTVEIGFNSTFWLELSVLGVIQTLADIGALDRERFERVRFHMLEASGTMEKFPRSTKSGNYLPMLQYLFDLGSQSADAWLHDNQGDLGKRGTYDLRQLLPDGAKDLLRRPDELKVRTGRSETRNQSPHTRSELLEETT